jgi:hypothetical protein
MISSAITLHEATGKEEAMDGGTNEGTAVVDGIPVRWLEQDGQGIPVVLVHGIPT